MSGRPFNVAEFIEDSREKAAADRRRAAEAAKMRAQTASNLASSLKDAFDKYDVSGVNVSVSGETVDLRRENGDSVAIKVEDNDYLVTESLQTRPDLTLPEDSVGSGRLSAEQMQEAVCEWAGIRLR